MILEWQNHFRPKHDGWYGLGFIQNYPVYGTGGAVVVSGTFIHRLLVLGVG